MLNHSPGVFQVVKKEQNVKFLHFCFCEQQSFPIFTFLWIVQIVILNDYQGRKIKSICMSQRNIFCFHVMRSEIESSKSFCFGKSSSKKYYSFCQVNRLSENMICLWSEYLLSQRKGRFMSSMCQFEVFMGFLEGLSNYIQDENKTSHEEKFL